jgi:hypothetical protein
MVNKSILLRVYKYIDNIYVAFLGGLTAFGAVIPYLIRGTLVNGSPIPITTYISLGSDFFILVVLAIATYIGSRLARRYPL